MRIAYDELLVSNVWDKRLDLPSVPIHLNPHIYTAYSVRILESIGAFGDGMTVGESENAAQSRSGSRVIRTHYEETFLKECELKPGLITTYDGSGSASHDDAHGACFLNAGFAARCVDYLSRHDGSYTDGPDTETKNIYRFFFTLPSMKAFAGFRVGLASQLLFIMALVYDLLFTKDFDPSGQLLLWSAFPVMRKNPLACAFIDYWSARRTKQGVTPKAIFRDHYLTECPWYGEWARDDWK